MIQKIRQYFIAGILVLGPVYITLVFIGYLVKLTDRTVVNPLFQVLPIKFDAHFEVIITKIAIAFFVLLFVCSVGFAAKRFLFKRFLSNWEGLLGNIPLFNKIYFPVKDIAEAFFGDKTGIFKRVVYVEYPRKGIYAVAFLTQEEKKWDIYEKTGKELVSVFVPAPPNPATGNFIFVPREEVIAADMTIEEAIKLVISGGAAVPLLKKK